MSHVGCAPDDTDSRHGETDKRSFSAAVAHSPAPSELGALLFSNFPVHRPVLGSIHKKTKLDPSGKTKFGGIEMLILILHKKYNFPCSLLSEGVRNSIWGLQLDTCVFRPTSELGPLRRLTSLNMRQPDVVCYARAELPSIMPNLETLVIGAGIEMVNMPMVLTKFLYLKHLTIEIWERTSSPPYDYFPLVSFFDASPSLETFFMNVPLEDVKHESVFGASSHLRELPEHQHNYLKVVEIIGFRSSKSLVELTCCIVKNAVSLECLTFDTFRGRERCYGEANETCQPISNAVFKEASRTVMAIRMYIEDKVASTCKLTVLGPCTRCHSR